MAVLYVADIQNAFMPTMLAAVLHEFGHIVAIKFCGGTVEKIDVRLCGVQISVPELTLMPYKSEIIIAAAGPVAGAITAILCLAAAKLIDFEILNYFVGINILISAINLLPIYPLDGGRIVRALSLILFPIKCANIVYTALSLLAATGVSTLCIMLMRNGVTNPTIVIFMVYVVICATILSPKI